MRVIACVAIAVMLSGCSTYRHVQAAPSRDWAVVQRLPPGTDVVALTYGMYRHGRLEAAGPDGIVLRTEHGVTTIGRTDVSMLSQRVPLPHERKWNMLIDAFAFSMIGRLFLPKIDNDLAFMAVVAGSGAAVGAMARPRMYNDTTIYIRPSRTP
jgi:hypothetical protein